MYELRKDPYGLSILEEQTMRDLLNLPFLKLDDTSKTMKTDILEKNGHFVLQMEIPGFDKSDIHVSVEQGYLTVEAKKQETDDEDNKEVVFYRKERKRIKECSRSFYIGDVKEESITAAYVNGLLILSYPSNNEKEQKTSKRSIDIV